MNTNKNTYHSSSIQNKIFECFVYFTKFTICIVFLLFSISLFAQTDENYKKTADDALQNGDYYTAAYFYKILLDKDNMNLDFAYRYANANRLYNNYKEAEYWFEFIVSKDNADKYPLSGFYLAEMNKYNAKYGFAISNYTNYYNKNREKKDYYTQKALQEINSCKWAAKHITDTHKVEITHLGKTINTPFSEFGAQQYGDSLLIYSSLREIASNEFESFLPEAYLSKVYSSYISVAGYSSGRELKGKINSDEINTANLSIDNKTMQAYFTRCSKNEGAEMVCAIYQSEFKAGKWEKAKKLNNKINLEGFTSTQPSVVNSNDKEILYFASNRPGGFGQMDIWYSIKNNGEFQQAVNLGSNINTPGNEITPFYDTKSLELYFASDWHFGFGGYDNFHSKGELNQWTTVENAGFPINTSYNDLYFTVNETENEGYLTSNRLGSYFIKGETCCNDIYAYKIFKKEKPVEVKKDTITIEESIKKLLPLTLYFHNDEPDPSCMNTTTDKNYKQTLADYYAMKDKYKAEYSKGLKREEYQKAINDIDTFFIKEVGAGFKSLELFTSLLLRDLQRGNEIRITVKGYASPLNTDEYNTNLSKRRISSLINFMKEFNNGILKPYMEDSNTKAKLIVYEEPLGKSMASKTVSDNPNDLRNSVYSKAAALERKIQILYYDYTKEVDSTPLLKFLIDSINLGKLNPTTTNAFSIRFKNAGKYPFSISDVSTDCSCIKYYFDETAISAGKEGVIRILIVPDERKGLKKQIITLTLSPFNKKVTLPVRFEE
ncbi:MAG: DUF1573 domain-containing protein [Bacteroidetes bacterium]|nr:DUF1573 domain-containing protein [Bacteroidota bacterium]